MTKKRDKYRDIIDDVFEFIKYRCGYCGIIMKENKNFCSIECKILYLKKMDKIKNGKYTSKKKQSKQHVNISANILSEEYLKQMVEETERNIDVKINKLRR